MRCGHCADSSFRQATRSRHRRVSCATSYEFTRVRSSTRRDEPCRANQRSSRSSAKAEHETSCCEHASTTHPRYSSSAPADSEGSSACCSAAPHGGWPTTRRARCSSPAADRLPRPGCVPIDPRRRPQGCREDEVSCVAGGAGCGAARRAPRNRDLHRAAVHPLTCQDDALVEAPTPPAPACAVATGRPTIARAYTRFPIRAGFGRVGPART